MCFSFPLCWLRDHNDDSLGMIKQDLMLPLKIFTAAYISCNWIMLSRCKWKWRTWHRNLNLTSRIKTTFKVNSETWTFSWTLSSQSVDPTPCIGRLTLKTNKQTMQFLNILSQLILPSCVFGIIVSFLVGNWTWTASQVIFTTWKLIIWIQSFWVGRAINFKHGWRDNYC